MANFNFVPHKTQEIDRKWNFLKTDMEGMRTKSRLKSSKKKRTWELFFGGYSTIEKDSLLSHYDGQGCGAIPFYWTSVPAHISSESSIYVRYVSLKQVTVYADVFEITIQLEESI